MIDFNNILSRVYVVPNFKRNDALGDPAYFHVSAFKWDRSVPDKSGFPVDDCDDDEPQNEDNDM